MSEYSSVNWKTPVNELEKPQSTVEFKWKIENFSSLPKEVDTFYESPHFCSTGFEWCLVLFPNGESLHSSQKWIGLYLKMIKCNVFKVLQFGFIPASCIIGIENINGTKEFQKGFTKRLMRKENAVGWKTFLERDELIRRKSQFYPTDTLTIFIWLQHEIIGNIIEEMTERIGNISIGGPWKNNLEHKGLVMLSSDLKNVFLEGQDSDVTINVKGKIFRAHKVILKARSEVLSSMLTHDMAEKKSNIINIQDCEPEAFKIFLLYLYSGKTGNLTETNVLHVYYIADKYNIPDLKAECVLYIKCSMSITTICSIIRLARKHGDSELLTCATDYFILNVHEILLTEEWKLFINDYPKYGNELYLRAIKSPNVSHQSFSQK